MEKGLELLAKIKAEFELPIVTDIHTPDQAAVAAEVADILQIPAFFMPANRFISFSCKTGKIVNIKKGNSLLLNKMKPLVKKVEEAGNNQIMLTDRGVSFGYK